jgi:hypothetical protein
MILCSKTGRYTTPSGVAWVTRYELLSNICYRHHKVTYLIMQDGEPRVAADAVKTKHVPIFNKFFGNPGVETVLHIINGVAERLDHKFVQSHRELRDKVLSSPYGGFLGANPSAWPGLAMHFNQMPAGFHTDGQSLHSGLDFINPWGPFQDCLLVFPKLGIAIRVRPGDIIVLRGAGLKHGVKGWTGKGRMVLVPFVDRRLFGGSRVKRPKTFTPLYGHQHNHLRRLFPAQRLADIL